VTVDGLLAVGRALPALRSLELHLQPGLPADIKTDATCAALLVGLEAVGHAGGGGGEPAEAEADAPAPGGPPPTFCDLLPAVRAALARLAAAQGAGGG